MDALPCQTDPGAINLCCLGTTHFINAIIRREGLARVAVLRLCGPATVALPPFCDMPPELCQATGASYHLLSGATWGGHLCLSVHPLMICAANAASGILWL